MSVQTELDRIITSVGAAYDAVEAKGGTAPAAQTIEGLAGAISGIKSAPATPYMEAVYVTVSSDITDRFGGDHYITHAKLYNHTAIYAYEFSGQTRLQNLDFSDASNNVTAIEANAFKQAQLNGLVLPNTIRVLGSTCFGGAAIATLTVPPLVTVLPASAFEDVQPVYNNATDEELPINIILPQNLTKIENRCFMSAQIKQITIPDTVTEIWDMAFNYCRQLASITCLAATPPTLGRNVFRSNTAGFTIKVPAASVAAYKAADGWKDYASYIVAM